MSGSTAPRISWNVTGATSVTVTGPGGFSATGLSSGPVAICPGTVTSGLCVSTPGTKTYTLRAFQGSTLVQAVQATLTIV